MNLDLHFYARQLRLCNTHHSISQGKQLHLLLFKKGLDSAVFFGNCLLQMYTRCGDLTGARRLFDLMPQRNCFSWNTLIESYLKSGNDGASLELFNSMPCKNDFSWNVLIAKFAKSGDLGVAEQLFEEMPSRNSIAWNSMIHGYVCYGRSEEALRLFKNLNLDPGAESSRSDSFILATVVRACANLEALNYGKQIHTSIVVSQVELDLVLSSSLVNMYSKCGDLDSAGCVLDSMREPDDFSLSALISGYANCGRLTDARRLFDRSNSLSVVLWNSMIAGYVANNQGDEALKFFNKMRRHGSPADPSTVASVLSACASLGILENGKQMHALSCKVGAINDLIAATNLVDMYSKCGSSDDACKFYDEFKLNDTIFLNSMINVYFSCGRVEDARNVFEKMSHKSLISWNSMIVGYSQNGCAIEALNIFLEMHQLDLRPDEVCLASIISTCAAICSLTIGEQVFARATVAGLESNQIISTSLVDLYCKCGNVKDGQRIFDKMTKSDEVPWNSMLMGYATNGYGIEVLKLFNEMRTTKASPNDITFIAVLSGCGHCRLIEEGRRWFHAMKNEYHINPTVEHYSCMVDMFARAGCIEEAMDFINRMPFEADVSMWTSLLRGCKAHGVDTLGEKVAERLIELDPNNSGAYVQLSNIYAARGEWERSEQVRRTMHERSIRKKNPGCSWVDDS